MARKRSSRPVPSRVAGPAVGGQKRVSRSRCRAEPWGRMPGLHQCPPESAVWPCSRWMSASDQPSTEIGLPRRCLERQARRDLVALEELGWLRVEGAGAAPLMCGPARHDAPEPAIVRTCMHRPAQHALAIERVKRLICRDSVAGLEAYIRTLSGHDVGCPHSFKTIKIQRCFPHSLARDIQTRLKQF